MVESTHTGSSTSQALSDSATKQALAAKDTQLEQARHREEELIALITAARRREDEFMALAAAARLREDQ